MKTMKKIDIPAEQDLERFEKEFKRAKEFFLDRTFVISDKKLRSVLLAIHLGYPVLATGPTGSGKTHFFQLLAEFLGGSYFYQSLNGSVTIHDLTQERVLSENGTFIAQDMILASWLRDSQKGISVCQLDEVNAARPETLLALHPVMDIKGELCLPYSQEHLKVTKNSILVMSCNEGDEYNGINAMNAAFQNRYIKIHFGYLDSDVMAKILQIKTGTPIEKTRKIVGCWEKYMSARDPEQVIVGMRILERWAEMSRYIGIKAAGEACFANLIATSEEQVTEIVLGDFFVNLPEED